MMLEHPVVRIYAHTFVGETIATLQKWKWAEPLLIF